MFHARKEISSACINAYVDDYIALSHHTTDIQDQIILENTIENILGKGSIKADKRVSPTTATDQLGWYIDLIDETIIPSDKSIDKLLYVFSTYKQMQMKSKP